MHKLALFGLLLCSTASAANNAQTRAILQDFLSEGARIKASLERDLNTVQANKVFALLKAPQTPGRAELEDALNRVAAAEKKFGEYEPQYHALLRSVCGRLAKVDPREGQACQASLIDSPVSKRFEMQRLYFTELRSLVRFLINKSGKYARTPQGFKFQAPADGTTFNALLDSLVARENAARSQEQQGILAIERMNAQLAQVR